MDSLINFAKLHTTFLFHMYQYMFYNYAAAATTTTTFVFSLNGLVFWPKVWALASNK